MSFSYEIMPLYSLSIYLQLHSFSYRALYSVKRCLGIFKWFRASRGDASPTRLSSEVPKAPSRTSDLQDLEFEASGHEYHGFDFLQQQSPRRGCSGN